MSKGRKLIAVLLAINALLLAGHLWVQLAGTPILARPAMAQRDQLPNAGLQRKQMIALLAEIRKSVDETKALLASGRVKVEVTALPPARTHR